MKFYGYLSNDLEGKRTLSIQFFAQHNYFHHRNGIYELPYIFSKNTSHSFLLSVYITTQSIAKVMKGL